MNNRRGHWSVMHVRQKTIFASTVSQIMPLTLATIQKRDNHTYSSHSAL